jgi:hypothetical protein
MIPAWWGSTSTEERFVAWISRVSLTLIAVTFVAVFPAVIEKLYLHGDLSAWAFEHTYGMPWVFFWLVLAALVVGRRRHMGRASSHGVHFRAPTNSAGRRGPDHNA